jgi:hypothetical protein
MAVIPLYPRDVGFKIFKCLCFSVHTLQTAWPRRFRDTFVRYGFYSQEKECEGKILNFKNKTATLFSFLFLRSGYLPSGFSTKTLTSAYLQILSHIYMACQRILHVLMTL